MYYVWFLLCILHSNYTLFPNPKLYYLFIFFNGTLIYKMYTILYSIRLKTRVWDLKVIREDFSEVINEVSSRVCLLIAFNTTAPSWPRERMQGQTHNIHPSFTFKLWCKCEISSYLMSRCEASHAVDVTEQSCVPFVGVDNQVGKRLLLLSCPGVTSARLVLPSIQLWCGLHKWKQHTWVWSVSISFCHILIHILYMYYIYLHR